MAHETLAVLPLPDFHTFTERITLLTDRRLAEAQLIGCEFESEYGLCHARATVHHVEQEREYCARHFREVERG